MPAPKHNQNARKPNPLARFNIHLSESERQFYQSFGWSHRRSGYAAGIRRAAAYLAAGITVYQTGDASWEWSWEDADGELHENDETQPSREEALADAAEARLCHWLRASGVDPADVFDEPKL